MALDILDEMLRVATSTPRASTTRSSARSFSRYMVRHGQDLDRVLASVEPLGFNLPAHRMTFPSGVTVQRVSKVEGMELLTLDLLLADGPLAEAWARGPPWRRSARRCAW